MNRYLRAVFGDPNDQLRTLMDRARAAGLPDIAVSSDVGRLLAILAQLSTGRMIIEVGTLGGYSTLWLARGLAPDGRLITIERDDRHADFAQGEFERAGLADRIEIRRGPALEILPQLADELGPDSVDCAFLDAVKVEYPRYLNILAPMIRPGGLLLADNALAAGDWAVTDPPGNPDRDAIDALNRAVADDDAWASSLIANREGLLVARRIR